MAIYHLKIDLSDVDRGVYTALDLRVALHPSEKMRFLLTRVIALCLCHEEGLAFSKGGLSDPDEPTISAREPHGSYRLWIEIGNPSPERLHKASKASARVVVFTHVDPEPLKRAAQRSTIYKVDQIRVYALDPAFLDALEAATERNSKWEFVHTEGQLYVTVDGRSITGAVTSHSLTDA